MTWFLFVQLLIMVVSLFGGSNVRGNVSLKKRVNTLEMRVNSIEMRVNTDNSLTRTDIAAMEQNIESLNMSLLILEDHICTPKGNAENQRHSMPGQSLSTENADVLHLSKIILSAGLADEKKWLRDKADEFRNELDESLSAIKRDISHYKTENDVKTELLQNKTDENLSVIKRGISKYETEIDVKLGVLASENDIKVHELKKHITDKTESQRMALDNLQNELNQIDTRTIKTEANIKKYLSSIITEMNKTLHSEVKALANIIIGLVNRTIKCPEGWTAFEKFCYLYFSTEKDYTSAQTECSLKGATVADIMSQAENDFFFQLAAKNAHNWKFGAEGNIFIGITDEDVENKWISDRTGSEAKFMNMRRGQPDGGTNQNCMMMGHEPPYDKWNDWPCKYKENFICKKEL